MDIFTRAGSRIHLDEPQFLGLVMQLVGGPLVLVANKPPLLGEVARRSRDGGVAILRQAGFLVFFQGLEAQLIAATPQALRASSPSRGAKYGRYL